MKTNLEKYNYYKGLIGEKLNKFISEELKKLPNLFYYVGSTNGEICEIKCDIENFLYFNYDLINNFYSDLKKPTKKNISSLISILEMEFKFDDLRIKTSNNNFNRTFILKNLLNDEMCFDNKINAEIKSLEIKEKIENDKIFKEQNKRNNDFKYEGYKFLGWTNAWISNSVPLEYKNCLELKHTLIHFHKDNRGYENITDCPICKIYWKTDSSD